MENLDKLIYKLIQLPNETPWVEFKYNNYNHEIQAAHAVLHGGPTENRSPAGVSSNADDMNTESAYRISRPLHLSH